MINATKLREIIENGSAFFREGGNSYIFTCPRCNKPRKLAIHKTEGFFCCYKCASDGFKGRAEYALAEIYNRPVQEFKDILYNKGTIQQIKYLDFELFDHYSEDFNYDELEPLEEVQFRDNLVDYNDPRYEAGLRYLMKRGLRIEHIQKYDIRFNTDWNTVVFPVKEDGILYGWQERSINNDFRYTLTGFKRDRMLMFQDNINSSEHCVLTEGPVDALKAELCGGNVCTMGKAVTEHQLDIIKSRVNKVYVALDPDASKEVNEVCRALCGEVEVYVMFPPKGKKDLGECTELEVLTQFQKATKWTGQLYF